MSQQTQQQQSHDPTLLAIDAMLHDARPSTRTAVVNTVRQRLAAEQQQRQRLQQQLAERDPTPSTPSQPEATP